MRDKYGLAPRLQSYSPVLAAFRRAGEAGKAYAVEAHMEAAAVSPEEPELATLLEVSAKAGDADRVYEYMHKLRRAVGCVSEETAEVLEGWFRSEKAAMAGKADWDAQQVKDAIVANGGGSHQLGWLRNGPWMVQRVTVGADGECGGCGCRLASVDIDMEETHKFADSVSGLALERETKANFSQFQLVAAILNFSAKKVYLPRMKRKEDRIVGPTLPKAFVDFWKVLAHAMALPPVGTAFQDSKLGLLRRACNSKKHIRTGAMRNDLHGVGKTISWSKASISCGSDGEQSKIIQRHTCLQVCSHEQALQATLYSICLACSVGH